MKNFLMFLCTIALGGNFTASESILVHKFESNLEIEKCRLRLDELEKKLKDEQRQVLKDGIKDYHFLVEEDLLTQYLRNHTKLLFLQNYQLVTTDFQLQSILEKQKEAMADVALYTEKLKVTSRSNLPFNQLSPDQCPVYAADATANAWFRAYKHGEEFRKIIQTHLSSK